MQALAATWHYVELRKVVGTPRDNSVEDLLKRSKCATGPPCVTEDVAVKIAAKDFREKAATLAASMDRARRYAVKDDDPPNADVDDSDDDHPRRPDHDDANEKLPVGAAWDYCRSVCGPGSQEISRERIEDSIQRANRVKADAMKLKRAATKVVVLRGELRRRRVDLDAWLEAAEKIVYSAQKSVIPSAELVLFFFSKK